VNSDDEKRLQIGAGPIEVLLVLRTPLPADDMGRLELFIAEHLSNTDALRAQLDESERARKEAERKVAHMRNVIATAPFTRKSDNPDDDWVCIRRNSARKIWDLLEDDAAAHLAEYAGATSMLDEMRKERDEHRGCAIALEVRAERTEAAFAEDLRRRAEAAEARVRELEAIIGNALT